MSIIEKHYFEHNSRKYFRGNAENIQLGSYGEKKDPVGPDAYLAQEAKIKSEHLASKVKSLGAVGVNWREAKKADVEAAGTLNVFGINAGRSISGSYEDLIKGDYKVVGFAINPGPLKTILNTEASGALKFLAREGGDGRVVGEIWVVMHGETSSYFSASADYTVSANVAGLGLDITVGAGTKAAKTVTISQGSTFAYQLYKVKKWANKDKTKIEDLEDDYKGMS